MAAPRPLSARTATVTAGLQVAARVGGALLAVGATAVITRDLGRVAYADWATVLSLIAMLGFTLDPGLAPVIVRRLTQAPDEAPAPASMLPARLVLAGVGWLLVVGLCGALRGTDALALAAVLAAQVFPRTVVLNIGAWMQAEHRLHRQAILEVATTAGGLALLLAGASLGASAPLLALLGGVVPASILAALLTRELHRLPRARGRARGPEAARVRSVLREAAPLAAGVILVSVYVRVNVVFVNAAEDSRTVAAYLLAFQLIEQVIVVAAILAATALPILAARHAVSPLERDPAVPRLLLVFAQLGMLVAGALIAGAEPFLVLLAGEDYREAGVFASLLAPTCVVLLANFFVAYVFVATGQAGRYLRFNAVGLAAAVAGNAIFTLPLGAAASARVSWIAELLVVVLALGPLAWATAAGRRAAVEVGVLLLVVVCAAELAAADVVVPSLAGALVALAVLASVGWDERGRRRRGEPPLTELIRVGDGPPVIVSP